MTDIKSSARETSATFDNKALNAIGVARTTVVPGREVFVQTGAKGLAVVRSGLKCGVTNGKLMVLAIEFDSVVILENGWMVACKHGIYDLYDREGNVYKGLSFLNKQNAIKFAKTL